MIPCILLEKLQGGKLPSNFSLVFVPLKLLIFCFKHPVIANYKMVLLSLLYLQVILMYNMPWNTFNSFHFFPQESRSSGSTTIMPQRAFCLFALRATDLTFFLELNKSRIA